MRKLYYEFFHIPEHGRIRERVMLTRVVLTTIIMLICLATMSVTAYAYFTYSITSKTNSIKTANFDVRVEIEDVSISNDRSSEIQIQGHSKTIKLEKGVYRIQLHKQGTAKTGFCKINAEGGNASFYTQQLGTDINTETGERDPFEFEMVITDDTELEILAHWGTAAYYDKETRSQTETPYIEDGDSIVMVINGIPVEGMEEIPEAETQSEEQEDAEDLSEQTELQQDIPPEESSNSDSNGSAMNPVQDPVEDPVQEDLEEEQQQQQETLDTKGLNEEINDAVNNEVESEEKPDEEIEKPTQSDEENSSVLEQETTE